MPTPWSGLSFGAFIAPFHPPDENPTLALERDLELIELLDRLGYDEAWVGEHHSGGWGTLAAPEVFLAAAAQRTRHITLGTGVVSLPYHHPLTVAGRMVLLDHLTRGRVIFGVGAGSLPSDAHMIGLDPGERRECMEHALAAIVRLLADPEPLTVETPWFELRDATLQLRPYSRPSLRLAVASSMTPSGMRLAGRYGAMPLSLAAFYPGGLGVLPAQWEAAEASAREHGRTIDRSDWRLVVPVHVAETREQALSEVREGGLRLLREYFHATLGLPTEFGANGRGGIEAMLDAGAAIVGTPDDCCAGIMRLHEASGGFGGLLAVCADWASPERTARSFELLARRVIPRFRGSTDGLIRSQRWVSENREWLMQAGAPRAPQPSAGGAR